MSNLPHFARDNYSDEELITKASELLEGSKDITLRAVSGYAIVCFMPYRRHGQIVIPDRHADESMEAIMIDDATGYDLPTGMKVICSRGDGTYFELEGIRFCRIKGKSMYCIEEMAA